MKLQESLEQYTKDMVYDNYLRIVWKFKEYEKITKNKMIEEIVKEYKDVLTIIEICTAREFKFLKYILSDKYDDDLKNIDESKPLSDLEFFNKITKKYKWEIRKLEEKLLVGYNPKNRKYEVFEDFKDYVQEALKEYNSDCKKYETNDRVNEFLIGFVRQQGSIVLEVLANLSSQLFKVSEEKLIEFMTYNRLFNFYTYKTSEYIESLDKKFKVVVYSDYYELKEELDYEREKQGIAVNKEIDIRDITELFYNDFNVRNPIIKKLVNKLDKMNSGDLLIPLIDEVRLLNSDREHLEQTVRDIFNDFEDTDVDSFIKLMNEAMDEMASGALNGLSPNELKEYNVRKQETIVKNLASYRKQVNACLPKKDCDLFYKLYFALLEFTNDKYQIKKNYKIYKKINLNPYDLKDIINKLWENKIEIIDEFIKENKYKFKSDELKIIEGFKEGIRDNFTIVKYELEYTALLFDAKTYMIKGIRSNIDEIISFEDLPVIVTTSIMPFKGQIIFDGILSEFALQIDKASLQEMALEEYNRNIKYYHM